MAKRIYRSHTIQAGGTQVAVRQVLGQGDSLVRQRMQSIANAAKGWLSQTVPACRSNPDPGVAAAYSHCFLRNPDAAGISTVCAVLTQVSSRLSQSYGVKVVEDDDAYGYVNLSFGGRIHMVDGMIQYDEDGDPISRGEIHLRRSTVLNQPVLATVTLIHEATHKFANLEDFGDQGYFHDDFSGYWSPGLTWNDALRNADSYAVFVYKVVESKFKSVLVT